MNRSEFSELADRLRADAPAWRKACAEHCRNVAGRMASPVDAFSVGASGPGRHGLWRIGVPLGLAAAVLLTVALVRPSQPIDDVPSVAINRIDTAALLDRPVAQLQTAYTDEMTRVGADAAAGIGFIWGQVPRLASAE